MKYPDYKVGIRCFTYNQADYITDAMNGFTMQQTGFPYLCCIVDDASTDGEQAVIKDYVASNFCIDGGYHSVSGNEYATIHFAQHKTNTNCFFIVFFLKRNLFKERGKKMSLIKEWLDLCEYHCLCEGDDYWTDPEKLQLQVNILDTHPDCSLTYHACQNVFTQGFNGNMGRFCENVKISYSTEEILSGYHFQTATIMYRTALLSDGRVKTILSIMHYSTVLFFCASMNGTVIGIDKQMSVYRRNNNGISNTLHKGEKTAYFFDKWCEIAECCDSRNKRLVYKTRVMQYLVNLYDKDRLTFRRKWKTEAKKNPYFALMFVCLLGKRNIRKLLHKVKLIFKVQ